jgi:shikimate kinase
MRIGRPPFAEFIVMKIFLTGVSCVGKTTVGTELASLLGYPFFDLDEVIEKYYGKPIERLQIECLTMYTFRQKACQALKHLLSHNLADAFVIALPPSGLMGQYPRVIKKVGGITVVLDDSPENILKRITFYDVDSKPIIKNLTEKELRHYLREIRLDITYFKRTYKKADVTVDISGLGPKESAMKVKDVLVARSQV